MRIVSIGGGPAGLFFSILMKKADPGHEVTVLERNRPDDTFGWGVVFSDETLGAIAAADPETYREITARFAHWDSIDVHFRGEVVRSGGHGFSGIARRRLLEILQDRARELGVGLAFQTEVDDVARVARECDLLVGADGVKSRVRATYERAFRPSLDVRKSKYIWLGTRKRFDAFTFIVVANELGVFQVHAYRFDADTSTFIVECDEASWRAAGLDAMGVDEGVAFLEGLFAPWLDGNRLLTNKSSWINFATVRNAAWSAGHVVLLGDAAHTAHFSIGSGTKLAMEDAIALRDAFARHGARDVPGALAAYEAERRPIVERTQKAAQDSLVWFEDIKRYRGFEPVQFAFSLLTRSKKVTYENLKVRDRAFVEGIAEWFVKNSSAATEADARARPAPPPMFTPFRLRGLTLANRVVVSPMCMYSADDGVVNDFHLVHLGSRAMGGAGLVVTEMTDVSREGRISPGCAGMYKPEHVAAWKRVVDFVHANTRAKIALQLGHAGRKGATKKMWEGMDQPLDPREAWPILSASAIPYLPHSQVPRAMERGDMARVRDEFVRGARMAVDAGFDMLELHFAHGYLLASFLSPLTNRREDEYGGSLENRLRFPLEVFDAVRAAWPAERPMSVRVSATDWVDGGLTDDEAVAIARAFREHGLDVIDVSTGQTTTDARPVFGRMWQTPFSDRIRNEAGIATIAVGNIQNADQVNSILASGRADLCALGRPHLYDPYWTLHAAAEQGWEVPWPVQYGPAVPPKKT